MHRYSYWKLEANTIKTKCTLLKVILYDNLQCQITFGYEQNDKVNPKLSDPKTLMLWHNRLGHPGATILRKIIDN